MIDITFNEAFADTLHKHLKTPVIALQFDLQIGSLHRLNNALDPFWQLKAKHDSNSTAAQLVAAAHQQLARLRKSTDAGEAVRVWWSDSADDTLGFLWLCDRLKDQQLNVTHIKVPLTVANYQNRDVLKRFATLGDIDSDAVNAYLDTAKNLSYSLRQTYSYEWRALSAANAPLRVAINGHMVGVPADFLDGALRQAMLNIKLKPVSFAKRTRIITETLTAYPIGVPAWWYRHRLAILNDRSNK